MTNNSKLLFGLVSVASALFSKKVKAIENINVDSILEQNENLIDIMIKRNTFKVDSDTNQIRIDEVKLLKSLQSELKIKMKKENLDLESKELYKKLLENLKPGSFMEDNNEFISLDHGKGG